MYQSRNKTKFSNHDFCMDSWNSLFLYYQLILLNNLQIQQHYLHQYINQLLQYYLKLHLLLFKKNSIISNYLIILQNLYC